MLYSRTSNNLNYYIQVQKVAKKDIAKKLSISPQYLSKLLSRPLEELTIGQIKGICNAIGLTFRLYLEQEM